MGRSNQRERKPGTKSGRPPAARTRDAQRNRLKVKRTPFRQGWRDPSWWLGHEPGEDGVWGPRRWWVRLLVFVPLAAIALLILDLARTEQQDGEAWDRVAPLIMIGTAFAGGALMATTRRVSVRLGGFLLVGAVWALITGYGLIALFDPQWAISDSVNSRRHRIETTWGARATGLFFLAFANFIPVIFAWSAMKAWWLRRRSRG